MPGQQVAQERADRFEVGDDVDGGRGERARQLGELGGLGVLDDDRAAGLLDPSGALGAVRAGAGQDDGDQALAEDLGGAGEEQVDRGFGAARLVAAERDGVVGDLDVAVGRHDVDDARPECLVLVHGADRQAERRPQDLAEVADPGRVEVLGDDDRRREIGGQGRDELRERLDAAGGGADDDEILAGRRIRHGAVSDWETG